MAWPLGMFSVAGTMPMTRTFGANAGSNDIALSTAAAPDMSVFIVSMPSAVLIDRPPLSNVMPLPTNASVARAPGGLYSSRIRRGGSSDPLATDTSPPSFSFAIVFSSQTVTSSPSRLATSVANAASLRGVMSLAGVLMRSRAALTAVATRAPRSTPADAFAPPLPATTADRMRDAFPSAL